MVVAEVLRKIEIDTVPFRRDIDTVEKGYILVMLEYTREHGEARLLVRKDLGYYIVVPAMQVQVHDIGHWILAVELMEGWIDVQFQAGTEPVPSV